MMTNKNLSLVLCLAVALGASGCASLKNKPAPTDDTQAGAQTTTTDTTGNGQTGAETGGLNSGGVNASDMGGANGTGSGATGAGQNGASAGGTGSGSAMAGMLAQRLVHFDYDSSDLSSEDMQTLQAHAQYLSQNPSARVLLAGHADERGTREYNMALGERRANAVQAYLSSNGARSGQLDTVSYGKEKPANDGHDESAWAENRRVEINYKAGGPR